MRQVKDQGCSNVKPYLEEQSNDNDVELNKPTVNQQTYSGFGGLNLAKYFFGQNLKRSKSVDEELQEYMKTPKPVAVNDLQYYIMKYWKSRTSYPTLRKVARNDFTIPASSTSCDRFFDKFNRFFDTLDLDGDNGRNDTNDYLFPTTTASVIKGPTLILSIRYLYVSIKFDERTFIRY